MSWDLLRYTEAELAELRAEARERLNRWASVVDKQCEMRSRTERCPNVAEFAVVDTSRIGREGVDPSRVCGQCLLPACRMIEPGPVLVEKRPAPAPALQDKPDKPDNGCPYGFSHTRHWCGYEGCREG